MIKNILFDWSGTLMDDVTATHKATSHIFKSLGGTPMSLDDHKTKFFLPFMDFWKQQFPNCTQDQIFGLFLEGLDLAGDAELYPNIESVLENLKKKGINMAIMSSHPQEKLVSYINHFGLSEYFGEIYGSVQNKTEVFPGILEENEFKPEETMYVGDMVHDIEAAQNAGAISVAITWGHQPEEMLKAQKPDYLISNLSELESLL